MSDGKEVKRWFIRCFLRNGIEFADIEGPLTHSKIEVMPVADHDRIVAGLKIYASELELKIADLILFPDQESSLKTIAELRAELKIQDDANEILTRQNKELRAEVEELRANNKQLGLLSVEHHEKIARQVRVIKKLREQREKYARNSQMHYGTQDLYKIDERELAAIERAEGEKE